jgi:predicted nucleic acid-binding protein
MQEIDRLERFSHPEELRSSFEIRFWDRVVVSAKARATPSGLISIGLMVSAIILAAGYKAAQRRRFVR